MLVSLGRPFVALWSANATANLADGVAFVTMPLLAASLTDDPRWVAGVATVYALVRLCVVLPIGVFVDRMDRRTLLVGANLLRGVALLALAGTMQFGGFSLGVLYAALAVVATLESAADGAAVAALPSLVEREQLDSANSRIAGVQLALDEFVGPPLGGALFAIAAVAPVYAMGGLWAAAGALALALPGIAPRRSPSAGPRTSVYAEARAGVAWLAGHRVVGALALIGGLASVGYMLPFSVLVLFAGERLGLDGTGYGLLLAGSALGGLAGAGVTARVRARFGYRGTITASLVLGSVSLVGVAGTTHPIVAGVFLALYILHAVVWNICATSLRQRLVPAELLGRVGAASRVLGLLGLALGSLLGGVLATLHLVVPTLVGAAVFAVCAVTALVMLRHRAGPARP